jgi:hypothetical protein
MNKMMLLIVLFLILTQCEDCLDLEWNKHPLPKTELEKLPPATQTGKNIFGCLINGKAWMSDYIFNAQAVYQQGILQFFGRIQEPNQSISFTLFEDSTLITEGTYSLLTLSPFNPKVDVSLPNHCSYGRDINDILEGELNITKFDHKIFVISGLFEFTATTKDCDTLIVTNGRFDIEYIP